MWFVSLDRFRERRQYHHLLARTTIRCTHHNGALIPRVLHPWRHPLECGLTHDAHVILVVPHPPRPLCNPMPSFYFYPQPGLIGVVCVGVHVVATHRRSERGEVSTDAYLFIRPFRYSVHGLEAMVAARRRPQCGEATMGAEVRPREHDETARMGWIQWASAEKMQLALKNSK